MPPIISPTSWRDIKNTSKELIIAGLWVLIFLIIVLIFFEDKFFNVFSFNQQNKPNDWNDLIIIPLTFLIVCAGWMQFKSLNKTSKAEFLLRIDERYGSIEIIKARSIIHSYYQETYHKDIDITAHANKIGHLILQAEKAQKPINFIYLLNFLDFLETVSYFTNANYISLDDINELVGGSIKYYYCVYKPFIHTRRKKYHCNKYYCELEVLAKKIQKKNPSFQPIVDL